MSAGGAERGRPSAWEVLAATWCGREVPERERTGPYDEMLGRLAAFSPARDAYAGARLGREQFERVRRWRERLGGARDPGARALESLGADRCPDCGYDLRGLPPAIPARITGVPVGPSACPECGSAWPLVPPPVAGGGRD